MVLSVAEVGKLCSQWVNEYWSGNHITEGSVLYP